MKRILASLIALVMFVGLLPLGAFADTIEITEVFLQMERYPTVGEGLVYPTLYTVNESEEVDDKLAITFSRWYAADQYTLDGNAYGGYYNEVFTAGKSYNLNIELTPADGYTLAEDCTVVLMAPPEHFGNGYEYPRSYQDGTVAYDFFFNLTGVAAEIESAQLFLSGVPEAGESLWDWMPELEAVDGNGEYLRPLDYRASWCYYDEEDETYYHEEDVFSAEREYVLMVEVFAMEEYVLASDFVLTLQAGDDLIYGEQYGEGDENTAAFLFELAKRIEIQSITIEATAVPVANATPFEFTVQSVNGSVSEIEAVEILTGWGKYDAEEDVYLPNGLIPFEAGARYAASIFLYAADGYTFADGCEVTVVAPTDREVKIEYSDSGEIDGAIFYDALVADVENDIDGNGSVDSCDVTALLKQINSSTADVVIGDLNGDGKVSLSDALRLLKQINA